LRGPPLHVGRLAETGGIARNSSPQRGSRRALELLYFALREPHPERPLAFARASKDIQRAPASERAGASFEAASGASDEVRRGKRFPINSARPQANRSAITPPRISSAAPARAPRKGSPRKGDAADRGEYDRAFAHAATAPMVACVIAQTTMA